MAQGEMFPERCYHGGCRNKVRVYIPEQSYTQQGDGWHASKTKPSCVKHADARQADVLAENALLLWASNRTPGEPDV